MKTFGRKPTLAWLPVNRLKVDARYQRDTQSRGSQKLIGRIADEFRWERFNVITAVAAGKGKDRHWFVIDGQHRVAACRKLGIAEVPASVLSAAPAAEAAAHFVAVNRDRITVNALQIHHAMLAAGDPKARRIRQVMDKAGVSAPPNVRAVNQLKPGETLAIGAVTGLVEERGPDGAYQVLSILARAYQGEHGRIRAAYINALSDLLAGAIGAPPTGAAAMAALKDNKQRDIDSLARAHAEAEGRSLTAALAVVLGRLCAGDEESPDSNADGPAPAADRSDVRSDKKKSPADVDTVVRFLQSRDVVVYRDPASVGKTPLWKVDGKGLMTMEKLLDHANVLRRALGKPEFFYGM